MSTAVTYNEKAFTIALFKGKFLQQEPPEKDHQIPEALSENGDFNKED